MTPTGVSFTTGSFGCTNAQGIEMNDTRFFIVDERDDEVYITYHNGTYIDSFDLYASGLREPLGIHMDDSYFWITSGYENTDVYRFYHNGTPLGAYFDTASSGMGSTNGITIYDDDLLIVDYQEDVDAFLYEFDNEGTFIETHEVAVDVPFGWNSFWGMTSNSTYLWILDDRNIHKYYLNTIPTVTYLMTENQTDPTQVVTNTSAPQFNWTYTDPNETQHSYQVQVGTTLDSADMWDSGVVVNSNHYTTYAGSTLARDTTYYVRVIVNDSYVDSTWINGTFKLNALPVVNNIVITPGAPLDSDDLVVSNDTATDVNGDSTVAFYKWYKNDTHQATLDNITTVLSSNLTNTEIWKVGVIPNDGYENGTEVFSATVTIGSGNTAPTLTSITTNVTSKKFNYTILVSSVGAFDADDNNYTLHVGTSTGLSDLCNSSSTVNGTEASCVITVPWSSGAHVIYARLTDTLDTSIEKNVVITVDTTPPAYVSSSVDPISTTGSQTVTITAGVTLANGSVDYVKARVFTPSAVYTNYTMTGGNGSYSYSFVPAVAGTYLISSILASDDSGNTMEESISLVFNVVTGGGSGGGAPINVTVVEIGDLTLTPDRRDTYFWYTALSGEQTGEWTFIANRNLETCRVEPNNYTSCEIVDGYIVKVRLTVDEDTPTYDGTLTVTDANDYTASSTIVIRVVNIWSAIPFPAMNVGPLSTVATPFFETEGNFIIGLRTYVLGIIGILFVFALFMSKKR